MLTPWPDSWKVRRKVPRIPNITREQLKDEDQHIFDEIAESRGRIGGPFAILLHSPRLASCVAATGAYLRFQSVLSPALREVAILATAREITSQYEFTSHVRWARQFNVPESTIDAIRTGQAPEGLRSEEAAVVRYVQELLRDRKVSDVTFDDIKERFGIQGVVDFTGIIGHYLMAAQVLAAFEVELPPGSKPELPI